MNLTLVILIFSGITSIISIWLGYWAENFPETDLENRNLDLVLESFRGDEENYHLINNELEKGAEEIESYFKRKLEKTYLYTELKMLIDGSVYIILEDELWTNNFEPFM